ncbi:MAG TPA: hypothetical protein VFA49_02695, partial [Chloroflexota bacterium]|nr:hypothetical protein [Chloroflexota bacterium]
MRPLLKAHVALVALLAATLVAADLLAVVAWPRAWSPGIALALLMLAAMADQLQFEVKRGWYTTAGAVPHLAAAFLLPPGVAAVVGAIGPVSRAVTHRRPARKVVFNTATTALALAATAHVVNVFGGADLVRPGGGWSDPLVAILASVVYYVTSGTLVALAVALDQGRPVWDVFRGKLGFKAASEIGLGLVGALLALMLAASANWAPVLLVPAVLLWLAKRSMDSADRRSRHLAVTSTVGRAVAGTLDAEHALHAITVPPVREGLKLDGLALLPLADPAPFGDHVATAHDTEWQMLREALVRELRRRPRDIVLLANRDRPGWLPTELSERPLAVAAFPFGAGSGRSVGALVAWREVKPRLVEPMDQEELLVLKTLADHAAVALETARLAHETARLHHEAGQAEARREMEALR